MDKHQMRKIVLDCEKKMTDEERSRSDELLRQQLYQLPEFRNAKIIMLFSSIGTEPDTLPIIERVLEDNKVVVLPRMLPGRQLEAREYDPQKLAEAAVGILEPLESCRLMPLENIDMILVPAVCYDRQGRRLGHGAGYYDRFLSGYRGVRVGFCRNNVLQELIPTEAHDEPVHILITEDRIYRNTSSE